MSCERERSGYLANCGSEPMVDEFLVGDGVFMLSLEF